jgi:hypothetical protein
MRRLIESAPSPALLIAIVALVAALAGTAVAGPGADTSAKKVTKAKVKKIANKQIDKALPWGTAELANGAVTSPVFGAIHTRTNSVNVPAGEYREVTANCQSGERVIAGGFKWNNNVVDENLSVFESHKEGEGWYARGQNAFSASRELTVEAYCLAA